MKEGPRLHSMMVRRLRGSSACGEPPWRRPARRRALSRQRQRCRQADAAARGQQGLLHRGPSRRTHQILASLLLGLGIVAAQRAGALLLWRWVHTAAVEATHLPASGKAAPASLISWVTSVFTRPSPAATRLVGMRRTPRPARWPPKLTGSPRRACALAGRVSGGRNLQEGQGETPQRASRRSPTYPSCQVYRGMIVCVL